MFYGIAQQHGGEYQSGLYFEKYPEIGDMESGRFFRYREQDRSSSMEDIVVNLSHDSVQKIIVSTYDLPWKSEAYVLLGDELWRIQSSTSRPINEQAFALVKRSQREHSITVRRVANATGIRR